jgi:hypothetical protein
MASTNDHSMSERLPRILYRLPVSLALIIGITLVAVLSGAFTGGTSQATIDRFGYSIDNLRAGHFYVIPTSDWFVEGPSHWASMMLLFVLFAIPLEWMARSGHLAVAFFVGSWVGTVVTSLVVLWLGPTLDWYPHPDLIHEADVGGSVGAWAAAGALNVLVGNRWPWIAWPVRIGSAAYLGYQLVAVHGVADVAHVLGFAIGTGMGFRASGFKTQPGPTVDMSTQTA